MTEILTLLENKYILALVSGIGGILLALITQKILNKRGLFTYFVQHNKIGVSADDAIYGSVRVTWNNNTITHLYMSTVELINQSSKDYESVVVRVYTNNTLLLSERTEIVDTTRFLSYTGEYASQIHVPEGEEPTEQQKTLYRRQRDYVIPTMNRNQIILFQYLNAANTEAQPSIWLDVLHTGVKLKFRVAPVSILGVPRPSAAFAGLIVGLLFVGLVISYIDSLWIASISTFTFGLIAQLPGAYTIKTFRKMREFISG